MLLVGDIGGTKTALAVVSAAVGPRAPLAQATFPSADYPSLEAVVREFLSTIEFPIERAAFAVAGPVIAGRSKITNLPWLVDTEVLRQTLHLPAVHLLNDLEAIAAAIPILQPADLHTLNTGTPVAEGAMGVVAPGTGLGEAFLTWNGTRYDAHPCEGGHADFAPTTEIEVGLLQGLLRRYKHVSVERVCSGSGLPNIYNYLRDSHYAPETPEVAAQLAEADDPTPVIVQAALDPVAPCGLCRATLDTFISILGAEAGNLALKVLSTGGLYLGGGIPPRLLSVLTPERFMAAFLRKGRFNELLGRMPVHVIVRQAALLGAAHYALQLYPDS
jgi:glucokinase